MDNSTSNASEVAGKPHNWQFVRLGGFDQVRLESGADIVALGQLDQKLWTALSCPSRGLEFDEKTLRLIDTDGDGRIRVPEIVAAATWAGSLLKDPDILLAGSASLPLAAIDDSSVEGQDIVASARQILINLGKSGHAAITAEDTGNTTEIFANTTLNGDGVICAESTDDETVGKVIEEIIACVEPEADRSGKPGINEEKLELFFTEAQAYSDWWGQAEKDADKVLFLGEETEQAAALFYAVKAKIDDFFVRCRLAGYDPAAQVSLNPAAEKYLELASVSLSESTENIAVLPIARIEADGRLPLGKGINPAWAQAIKAFQNGVARHLIDDQTELSFSDWEIISAKFSAMDCWLAEKQGTAVEALGLARVREILAGGYKESLLELIEQDKSLDREANAIDNVDRLVNYYQYLYQLLNNFVSFQDFYTPKSMAIFQAGTLYLDGRSCELCVRVDDPEKHSTLATLSQTYLIYCQCRRRNGEETMYLAVALTDGDADNIRVGRNGVFYDRKGEDWDATIVKIVENPISIRQAFLSPYKRIGRMIGEQIEKFAASREKAVDAHAEKTVTATSTKGDPVKAMPAPFDLAKFAGIFAAIGLAIGAIGTAFVAMVTGFLSLLWWQIPIAFAIIIMAISGPSMIIAWLKLRQRNLAPILDACGWAINTQAKINIPFGTSLTAMARLPAGGRRLVNDPFAEKKVMWKTWLALLAVIAALGLSWYYGLFSINLQSLWQ
jgi:hypothetical protein